MADHLHSTGLAFAGSWIGWSPWWLSQNGVGLLDFDPTFQMMAGINQVGLFAGPFAAALIVTRVCEGRAAVSRLLRAMTQWRVRPVWFIVALVVIPIVVALGYVITSDSLVSPRAGAVLAAGLLGTYVVYLLGGEEIGWRGFALPRLQLTLHPVTAALVLGVVHSVWHAPLFLTSEWDTAGGNLSLLLAYLVLVVSLSIVLSWMTNSTRGSLLIVILGHNSANWGLLVAAGLTGDGDSVASSWPAAIGLGVLAVFTVIVTRGNLGHQKKMNTSPPINSTEVP